MSILQKKKQPSYSSQFDMSYLQKDFEKNHIIQIKIEQSKLK